ncbi:MAG: diguanylate cyclase [Blastopirellula sp.]|nr:MAG: diguanylate cyclase [Blastopirellula sp.]
MSQDKQIDIEKISPEAIEAPEEQLHALSKLLEGSEKEHGNSSSEADQNQMLQVKLGIASSLFVALRCKHPPSAAHCVRVSMQCSAWAAYREMSDTERDELEVAALLHDIGKVGVPDFVLASPGSLTESETMLMERHHEYGIEILEQCCAGHEVIEIVKNEGSWYNGTKQGYWAKGTEIPLGARMLAIVDAYDSMTADQLYRRTRSKDRALAELHAYAGTQFDPDLVSDFNEFQERLSDKVQREITKDWLKELNPTNANAYWNHTDLQLESESTRLPFRFHENLVRHIHDGIIYIDADSQIIRWNHAAERLTGISADAVVHRRWSLQLIELHDESGKRMVETDDPIATALKEGLQSVHRFNIRCNIDQFSTVTMHVVPLLSENGSVQGVTIQLHDASGMLSLEEKLHQLQKKASSDSLTSLFNRAEFDQKLEEYVQKHKTNNRPCSLIICDLDFFKKINDNYGHQAGDEALVRFAALLKRHATANDIAARYGGEEFVLLCGECDNSTAARKAEAVRAELASMTFDVLNGKTITASFGVTELQAGDTPETMLNRSDRALLHAKEMGRDMVIQLGAGLEEDEKPVERRPWWTKWLPQGQPEVLLSRCLISQLPMPLVSEKLKGFISDHMAKVVEATDTRLLLVIENDSLPLKRRSSDRIAALQVEVRLEQDPDSNAHRTFVQATVTPSRNRDRRQIDGTQRARQIMLSLQSYLMAYDIDHTRDTTSQVTKRGWQDWFASKNLPSPSRKSDESIR